MSIRHVALLFCMASLFSCSSSPWRAPVSDLTLFANGGTDGAPKEVITETTYRVQKGDTLYSIGWRSGIAVNSLIRHNNLKKPYIIDVGQILRLTNDKPHSKKKSNRNSDLSPQKTKKNSHSGCTAQNCQKKQAKKVAQQKTKVYSTVGVDKKTATKNKIKEKSEKVASWSWPVNGTLTKKFAASLSGMQGISIVNKHGSLIYAAASGQVVYAGSGLRGYGNLIIIKHNDEYLSAYAHNETLFVRENEKIKKGQKIATMGDSGTDHVHLHFEIRYRGKSVDPLRYLPKR